MYILDDTNTLRRYIEENTIESENQLGDSDTRLLEEAIKAMQDSKQPINVTVNIPEREIKQADINLTIPSPNVNVTTPEVLVANVQQGSDDQKEFVKSLRKLAHGK